MLSRFVVLTERIPLSAVQLAMRIGVGSVFFSAGVIKYRSWELTLALFRDEYRVPLLPPELAARLAMAQELTLPILLFLGLGTRMAALPLLGMIVVIQTFVYPSAWIEHLVWSSVLVFLIARGPGPWSVDRLIARLFGRHRREIPAALRTPRDRANCNGIPHHRDC